MRADLRDRNLVPGFRVAPSGLRIDGCHEHNCLERNAVSLPAEAGNPVNTEPHDGTVSPPAIVTMYRIARFRLRALRFRLRAPALRRTCNPSVACEASEGGSARLEPRRSSRSERRRV